MLQKSCFQVARGLALVTLASAPLAAAQGASKPLAESVIAAVDAELTVNGVTVPPAVVRRVIAQSSGTQLIELRKMDLFLEDEIARQVRAGKERSEFELSDTEVESQVASTMERLAEEYPGADIDDVLSPRGLNQAALAGQVAQTTLFDRVFLPDNPHDWPDTTVAAIQSQAGQEFIDKLIEGWDQRQESGEVQDPNDPGHLMWKNIMRQFVIKALNDSADIIDDGSDPTVLLELNGRKLMTDEIFMEILGRGRLNPHDIQMARLWAAKLAALEAALKREGVWIEDEEFVELWRAEEEPYLNSPFNLQVIAVGFRKFPSIEAYKNYFRIYQSYQRLIADEINDDNLGEHLVRANPMLGLAKVRTDVLLVSAFDPLTGAYREGGWEKAEVRAGEVAEALAKGMPWEEALDTYSDFTDPLVAESQKGKAPASLKKGRFPLLHRNELVQRLGESDFYMFLRGTSVVDYAFFDQPVGTIDGPFEGVQGYYITKVVQRTKPGKLLALDNESQRNLITQDYVAVRLNEYGEQALADATIAGL